MKTNIIDFLNIVDKGECAKMMEEFYQSDAVDHNIPKEFIENTIEMAMGDSPYNKIIICKSENKYAGFCHIAFSYSCEAGGLVAIIEELYVRDDFKGKGLGTSILSFIHDKFDDKVKRYRLEVVQENLLAIKLYERLGFKMLPYRQMVFDMEH